jgi:hypothetical protein
MKKVIFIFRCPKCRHPTRAEFRSKYKFLIYKCPNCMSNVVFYDNRLDIISDQMIERLKSKRKLRKYANVFSSLPAKKPELKKTEITPDKINNLKILLETETNFDRIISQL